MHSSEKLLGLWQNFPFNVTESNLKGKLIPLSDGNEFGIDQINILHIECCLFDIYIVFLSHQWGQAREKTWF